jgi:hypothetical protein
MKHEYMKMKNKYTKLRFAAQDEVDQLDQVDQVLQQKTIELDNGLDRIRTTTQIISKTKYYKHQTFETINWLAAAGHLANAILTYIIGDEKKYDIYESYAAWTQYNETNGTCPPFQYKIKGNRGTFLVNPRAAAPTFRVSLFWLIFSFHILSAIFQGYAGCRRKTYVSNIIDRGVNPLRFVEYSVSATIMLLCIALVSGIDEYYAIIAIGTLTFITMILGLVAELLFDDRRSDHTLKQLGWVVHFTGWVTMLVAYLGFIFKQYFFSIQKSEEQGGEGPPDWVTVIIFAVFGLYNIFGITQFLQLWCKYPVTRACMGKPVNYKDKGVCGTPINIFIEIMYVSNSLVTKTLLGWMILANLVIEDERDFC